MMVQQSCRLFTSPDRLKSYASERYTCDVVHAPMGRASASASLSAAFSRGSGLDSPGTGLSREGMIKSILPVSRSGLIRRAYSKYIRNMYACMSSRRHAGKAKKVGCQIVREELVSIRTRLTSFHPTLTIASDPSGDLIVTSLTLGRSSEAAKQDESTVQRRRLSVPFFSRQLTRQGWTTSRNSPSWQERKRTTRAIDGYLRLKVISAEALEARTAFLDSLHSGKMVALMTTL